MNQPNENALGVDLLVRSACSPLPWPSRGRPGASLAE